ncbi:MAG: tRNA (adenosine(37)-N6)-threonylcarbamoyltransferase complex dimerization subunit type 1 TsaB [Desulfuromonas sp.]|nr:tRNA (adenosine(37)-N6)-threonylcarbamoyltransferase complex dimerization subunit type 1 TsaB [Desulfuromonas sp.]
MTQEKNELLLCVDSSTPTGSVAVVSGTSMLMEVSINVPQRSHSDYLLRYVQFILSETGLDIQDIGALAVVVGPGSFTGLRVGLATVQGLAQANDLPIYPVSALQTVAFANGVTDLPVQVLIDARKHEVYSACYRWEAGVPVLQGAEQVMSPRALLAKISCRSLFVGNGALLYRELLEEQLPALGLLSHGVNAVARASAAGLLVHALGAKAKVVNCFELRPVYVRLSDAELQRCS